MVSLLETETTGAEWTDKEILTAAVLRQAIFDLEALVQRKDLEPYTGRVADLYTDAPVKTRERFEEAASFLFEVAPQYNDYFTRICRANSLEPDYVAGLAYKAASPYTRTLVFLYFQERSHREVRACVKADTTSV